MLYIGCTEYNRLVSEYSPTNGWVTICRKYNPFVGEYTYKWIILPTRVTIEKLSLFSIHKVKQLKIRWISSWILFKRKSQPNLLGEYFITRKTGFALQGYFQIKWIKILNIFFIINQVRRRSVIFLLSYLAPHVYRTFFFFFFNKRRCIVHWIDYSILLVLFYRFSEKWLNIKDYHNVKQMEETKCYRAFGQDLYFSWIITVPLNHLAQRTCILD